MLYRLLGLATLVGPGTLLLATSAPAEVYEVNFDATCSLTRETKVTKDNAYCLESELPLNNLENKKQNLDTLENVEEIDGEAWELQILYERCVDGIEADCEELQREQRRRLDRVPAGNSATDEEPFEYDLSY